MRGLSLNRSLRPTLGRGLGGYSGPALKPIALGAVYACRRVTKLPIVGIGGIKSGRDALEFIAAGATEIGLGTVLFSDPEAPSRVRSELAREVENAGFESLEAVREAAHEAVVSLSN
jgi:dihydroorotate dehydrogenase (NAD+) catalytic subunit